MKVGTFIESEIFNTIFKALIWNSRHFNVNFDTFNLIFEAFICNLWHFSIKPKAFIKCDTFDLKFKAFT